MKKILTIILLMAIVGIVSAGCAPQKSEVSIGCVPTPVPTCTPEPTPEPTPIPTPEFPSIAIPIGMMIGVLGVAMYVRK